MMTAMKDKFVSEYLTDLNATQAAIRAGYSAKSAYAQGCRLLKDVDVSAAIAKARAEIVQRNRVSVDEVVEGLLREARLEGEGATHTARVAAWAHLGKYLGMFVDKSEVSGSLNVPTVTVVLSD